MQRPRGAAPISFSTRSAAPIFEAALRALAWCGRLVVIGFAAGAIPTIPDQLSAAEEHRDQRLADQRLPQAPPGAGYRLLRRNFPPLRPREGKACCGYSLCAGARRRGARCSARPPHCRTRRAAAARCLNGSGIGNFCPATSAALLTGTRSARNYPLTPTSRRPVRIDPIRAGAAAPPAYRAVVPRSESHCSLCELPLSR